MPQLINSIPYCACLTVPSSMSGRGSPLDRGISLNSANSTRPNSQSSTTSEDERDGTVLTKPARRIVLITGGCGFLGVEIARHVYIHWRSTVEIRLVDVSPPPATVLQYITNNGGLKEGAKVIFYKADVLDRNAIRAAFVKVDVVFHCAALVETGSIMNRRRMKTVNIDGTRNVIGACSECGVRCLVFPGSINQVLTTSSTKQHFIDESVSVRPGEELIFPFYGHTISEAENLVIHANDRVTNTGNVLHTCSLRFPPFYGENDQQFVPIAFILARRCFGFFPAPADSRCLMSSMYVGNAAWAQLCAAEKLLDEHESKTVGGEIYYIGDDTPATNYTSFFSEFLSPLGYRVSPLRVPLFILLLFAYIFEFLSICLYWVGIDFATTWNRSSIKMVRTSHSIRWQKAKDNLKYRPLYPFNTALGKSMQYYRQLWAKK